MSSADEQRRRSAARKRFTEQSLQADAAEHRDALSTGSDKPSPAPRRDFSSLPNSGSRPGWAPNR
ncbi:MAG TPA: hypothetical protein VGS60_10755 [Actinomycetes bacterium]|nr:hypothetical protein [Actinomycetes bacterium]